MNTASLSPRSLRSPAIYLVIFGLIAALFLFPILGSLSGTSLSSAADTPRLSPAFSQLPLAFVPDQGTAKPSFRVYGAGNSLTFTPDGITFDLPSAAQTLQLHFQGANPAAVMSGEELLPTRVNEFRGQDAGSWRTNIPTYAAITYQGLYPGIDLHYAGEGGVLKSTFVVAPGANPANIRWDYQGAESVVVEAASGDLIVSLPDQEQLIEAAPVAWQEIGGQQVPVSVGYALSTAGSVSFSLGSYNPVYPLVIDPTFVYETILHVGDFAAGLDIAVDSDGSAVALSRVIREDHDVVVAKFNPDGDLLFVTYLSGSALEWGNGISLDSAGDIYLAGWTDSYDFPILNAYQDTKNGSQRETFITKLDGTDGGLLFSTFFGGSRSDEIHDIALNDAGEIFLVGYTESTDFPTQDPIQAGLNLNQCFCEDTFVTKFSPDALTVLFSTYLGGSFEDYGESIALDGADNIYITGRTQSDDFPTLVAIQPGRAGEYQDEDLFVTKISNAGNLVYSTYLGGTNYDFIRRLAVDDTGNAYLAGSTMSADFPTTAGSYQDTYIGEVLGCGIPGFGGPVNCHDAFLTKILPDGSALDFSTYLGGTHEDYAIALDINADGEAYLIGYTSSTDFPGVTRTGPGAEITLAKFNASGSELLYTVIIDSVVPNAGHGISLGNAGDIYITAAQNTPSDLYVAKLTEGGGPSPTPTPTPTPIPSGTVHVGDLDGSSSQVRRRAWEASVTIRVDDADHNPVAGATVSGAWSNGYNGSAQCTTGFDGMCTVISGSIRNKNNSVTFRVSDISAAGVAYTPAQNHDPDGDSNGTQIVVVKP